MDKDRRQEAEMGFLMAPVTYRAIRHLEQCKMDLVDTIVEAVDIDRIAEIERVVRALEPFGLGEAFSTEIRLSGVGSLTWGRCEFCSDVVDSHEMAS